jgi:ubiquinone/menaquinone biosynthesis C-methylase UbiE
MPEIRPAFDDADAYDRYMGRWSKAIGEKFLAWLAPLANARWLDIGCGTGAFSQLIAERCAPKSLSGIDPSPAQIEAARAKLPNADLRVGDSLALPFGDGEFDIVASALVLHFIPDRAKAFSEMKRVVSPGGVVAAYTWERSGTSDFAPYAPMLRGLDAIGVEPLRSPTVPEQQVEGLRKTAEAAGLANTALTHIEATQNFRDFDEFWNVQTLTVSPVGKTIAKLDDTQRARLRKTMQSLVPIAGDGSISYSARAVAFMASA